MKRKSDEVMGWSSRERVKVITRASLTLDSSPPAKLPIVKLVEVY